MHNAAWRRGYNFSRTDSGFQAEGASYRVIQHNTVKMITIADSALAIWDSLKSSHDILVKDNLLTGGGFAIYAEDYNPGTARRRTIRPPAASP